MAVEDDMIRKNPFKFKLSDVVPNDAYVRNALTKSQQERYLQFVCDCGVNYYDDIVILLGTGLRVSELYGLTKSDIDFERGCVRVQRQLCRTADKPYFITTPKTDSGNRYIPMTDTVCEAFKRVLVKRGVPKVEMFIDGCSGFLFLDRAGKPKVGMHLQNYMRGVRRKWLKQYGNTLPNVTPHVLRHTFCTDIQQTGIDVKCLQYLMGHWFFYNLHLDDSPTKMHIDVMGCGCVNLCKMGIFSFVNARICFVKGFLEKSNIKFC